MKKVLLAGFSFWFSLLMAYSQTAPDFTVTDAHGNVHQLYADYLNQGKTVLLELFFVDCPPCNAIAPSVQRLYDDWGGGTGDVEFIGLSTLQSDTDQKVRDYEARHGLTFPEVSPAGGSIMASLPYRNGTFGFFIGTPTFVVISPDGTVNYGIRGNNNAGTIDALDAALAATGAVKPKSTVELKGTIRTIKGRAIPGVKVSVFGFPNLTALTDQDGQFSLDFDLAPGLDYNLVAEKQDDFNEGVTILDVVRMRKHILAVDTFDTPFLYFVADLNLSNSITTLDQVAAIKLLSFVSTSIANRTSPWQFTDADLTLHAFLTNPAGGRGKSFNAASDLQNLNLIGTKAGDLNDSSPLD